MANMSFVVLLTILIFNFNVSYSEASGNNNDAVGLRIYLGLEANDGEYPFIARIHDYKDNLKAFCTASIIHENWILTAGHCLSNNPQKVTVGTTLASGRGGRTYDIRQIYIPDDYATWADVNRLTGGINHYYSDSDIGLIQLQSPIDFTQSDVETIPIDATSTDYEEQDVVYVGWGKTQINEYSPAERVQFAQGRVTSTKTCEKNKPYWVIRSSQHMCIAPLFNSTICPGDAGGPLLPYGANKQIGVANHATCEANSLSVFQRISVHYPWIKETIQSQGDTLSDE